MASTPSLMPREHGAYAQLAVALGSALVLAPSLRGGCQALLVAALFLASEPVLVLQGRRGLASQETGAGPARTRLGGLAAVASLALAGAWLGQGLAQAWTLAPPALLGLGLLRLFLAGRERTGYGEVLAAWTFAATSLAVTALGGAGPRRALLLALHQAALFSLATAVVHGHLRALPKGRSSWSRLAAAGLGLILVAGSWALGRHRLVPATAYLAFVPMALAAAGILLRPPAATKLKAVGWIAAGCTLAGAILAALVLA